jgi:hypothetical protein
VREANHKASRKEGNRKHERECVDKVFAWVLVTVGVVDLAWGASEEVYHEASVDQVPNAKQREIDNERESERER